MGTRKNDLFIEMLVDETYQFLPNEDTCLDSISLSRYFANKEEEHAPASNSDKCFHVSYRKELGCYRVMFGLQILDFPSNWSIFQGLKNKMATGGEYRISLGTDASEEAQLLNSILMKASQLTGFFVLVGHEGQVQLEFFELKKNLRARLKPLPAFKSAA